MVEDDLREIKTMNGSTPGWKTSEFYLHLASQAAILWGAVQGFVPPKWAAIISTVGIAVYTVARTVLKTVTDVKAAQTAAEPAPVAPTSTVVVQNNP